PPASCNCSSAIRGDSILIIEFEEQPSHAGLLRGLKRDRAQPARHQHNNKLVDAISDGCDVPTLSGPVCFSFDPSSMLLEFFTSLGASWRLASWGDHRRGPGLIDSRRLHRR